VKYILWDFDGTLAYRDGNWSGALYSILLNNGITDITLDALKQYLTKGFTWHSTEKPNE